MKWSRCFVVRSRNGLAHSRRRSADCMFYIAGPGHGDPALVGNVYLEGTWTDIYPNVTQDEAGSRSCSSCSRFLPSLCERGGRGKASNAPMADHGSGDRAL